MIVAIVDTHAAIWYLFSDPRLGRAACTFIDDTIANGEHIGVSAHQIRNIFGSCDLEFEPHPAEVN